MSHRSVYKAELYPGSVIRRLFAVMAVSSFNPDNIPHSRRLVLKSETEFYSTSVLDAVHPVFDIVDDRDSVAVNWIPHHDDSPLVDEIWDSYQYHRLERVTWKMYNFRRNTSIFRKYPGTFEPHENPSCVLSEHIESGTPSVPFTLYYDRGSNSGTNPPDRASLEDWSSKVICGPDSHIWGKVNCRPDVTRHHGLTYELFTDTFSDWRKFCGWDAVNGRFLCANAEDPAVNNNLQHLGCRLYPGPVVPGSVFEGGPPLRPYRTGEDTLKYSVVVYSTWQLYKRRRARDSVGCVRPVDGGLDWCD